ncbi:lytic murein transglycosylase B [Methylococcus geothermalis]|uniref:Lytic murein transglycosylase B n=1 Tax=Methylococcus geothermalis TaxID=2681310 RepID=A0A858Q7R9_9GAMM|nr:lytic murein transglycosylase B [Methylococcus geothermalis]QJD29909.1 lytic murein transglycosylase B [Methylococcus geothermalis]
MHQRFHLSPAIFIGLALLSGCASDPPARRGAVISGGAGSQPIAGEVPRAKALESAVQPKGGYSALRVSGDYAGYPALDRFIARMAQQHGFPRDYLNGLFSQAQRKTWTIDYMRKESKPGPPSPGGWSRYRAQFLDKLHVSRGVEFWRRHAGTLRRASEHYGVPPEYILGIMGVETAYGANLGGHRVLDALTTLAFDSPRRADYFADELEKFLLMARQERIDPTLPKGSFAGAMGLGQFMPSSFLNWAVDFDGDGRKDLWQPADAIGSIANYFAAHGWRSGDGVVMPAVLKVAGANELETGYDTRYSVAELARYGIVPARTLAADTPVSLLRLRAEGGDEYWLGLPNFYAITRYNNSTYYAMAVHELAQAIKARYE